MPDFTMRGAASDVLNPTGAVIEVTASVEDAEQRIDTLGASALYAVSADGQLMGILPDYELLKRRLSGDRRQQRVADVMSPVPVSVRCGTPLSEVAIHMRNGCHQRIPVVSNGRLVGEVTRRGLLHHLRTCPDNVFGDLVAGVAASDRSPGVPVASPKFLRNCNSGAGESASPGSGL